MKGLRLNKYVLLLLALLFIIGCSSNSGSDGNKENDNGDKDSNGSPAEYGGEIKIGYYADISNYDPIKGSSGADHPLLWPVYDTLVKFSPELEPLPGLAESWDIVDDKTISFKLRENVKFHDGTDFDAEAVKFNIERVISEDSNISDLNNIESVEVVDEHNVTFHLEKPDSSIILALADRGGMIVSPSAVEEFGEDYSQNPVGAGPYKLEKYSPGDEIVLVNHEDYWDKEAPYTDKMTIKLITDENTRINGLKGGELDFIGRVTPANVDSLESDPNLTVSEDISLHLRMAYINSLDPPFDNKDFRLAVLHGLNRDELLQALNFGKGEVGVQPFPQGYWATDPDLKLEYDLDTAKEYLEKSGVTDPSFTMLTEANSYSEKFAEAIKGQLKQVGIEVKVEPMELTAAVSKYFSDKSANAFLTGWTGRTDPQMTTASLFSADSFYHLGESTEELEKLISEAAGIYDLEERAEKYKEINRIGAVEEGLILPVFYTPEISAMNGKVKGFEPNLYGKLMFSTLYIEQ